MISALLAGSILCLASCSDGRLPTRPVSGRLVDQRGNGVAGAELNFYADEGIATDTVFPQAFTGPDGSFQVRTYDDADGAPLWCGVPGCVRAWPAPQVAPGGTVTVDVLEGWVDPDGDAMYVAGATTTAVGAAVAASPEGAVVVRAGQTLAAR